MGSFFALLAVASLAALRTVSVEGIPSGSSFEVLGYAQPADGGEGQFVYLPEDVRPDNDGTVIAPASGKGRFVRLLKEGAIYSVKWFGAIGDGISDDTAGINRCAEALAESGGGTVFLPRATYVIKRRNFVEQGPGILLSPGVSLEGNGSTLRLASNACFVAARSEIAANVLIMADVSAGDSTFTTNDAGAFRPGDDVGIRLNDNLWDKNECGTWYFARVVSVSGRQVTMDRTAPVEMKITRTTEKNRRVIRFSAVYRQQFIRNLVLESGDGGNAESGIDLRYTQHCVVENIHAKDPGAGAVLMAYGFQNHVANIQVTHSEAQNGQGSKGRGLNVWNSDDCSFSNISIETFQGAAIFVESYCHRLRFEGVTIINNWTVATGKSRLSGSLIFVAQGSEAHFDFLTLTGSGRGVVLFDQGGTPANITASNVELATDEKIKGGFNLGMITSGFLKLDGYVLTERHSDNFSVQLEGTSPLEIHPPRGYAIRSAYRLDGSAGIGTKVFEANERSQMSYTLETSGRWVSGGVGGGYGDDYPMNTGAPRSVRVNSSPSPGNAAVTFRYEYFEIPQVDAGIRAPDTFSAKAPE